MGLKQRVAKAETFAALVDAVVDRANDGIDGLNRDADGCDAES
jgi:hypothetical protein